jgi:type 1 glutamine amidotransferase
MQVLVLCGDRWHPPEVVGGGLESLRQTGLSFDLVESMTGWSVGHLENYPAVLLTKSNNVSVSDQSHWMTPAIEEAFKRYVHSGGGLLAVHSGTAEYENNPVLRGLLGGVFASHPEQCPVTVSGKADHPLCVGSEPFTLKDEQYFMEMDDPEADVFLTTISEHGEQSGGWTRTEGQGRVCVLTPGHNLEVWQHPSFQRLLVNALSWVAKR